MIVETFIVTYKDITDFIKSMRSLLNNWLKFMVIQIRLDTSLKTYKPIVVINIKSPIKDF